MIYTIGDSHSYFGWHEIDKVICLHLGPRLMYSFTADEFKNIKYNINEDDCIIFCFGEIDVRCHIKPNSLINNYKNTIMSLTNKYISTIMSIKKEYNIKNIFVYNVLPTRRIDTKEPYDIFACESYTQYDEEKAKPFSFIGSDIERLEYVRTMNLNLKLLCENNQIGFIDVFDKYADVDGYLNMLLSDGTIHIQAKHLKEYVYNNLGEFI